MRRRHLPSLLLACCLPLVAACGVRKDLHQAALDAIAEGQDRLAALGKEIEACQEGQRQLDAAVESCKAELASLAAARDEVLADNTALRARLKELGKDVESLSQDKSALSKEKSQLTDEKSQLSAEKTRMAQMLAEAQRALEEARARQKAAEARDAIYRRVKDKLQKMIDAGKLTVRVVRGRMVIDLKQDILFPSGSAELNADGIETLAEVAHVLREFQDRGFQVEGHTDNVPIKTAQFPSNWELSTARAVAVVKLFQKEGMVAEKLSAAGYGEFQPRADNASAEGRALNRRIEVVMLPDLQLLPDLVDSL
jgi:chemotaxis protein MotB